MPPFTLEQLRALQAIIEFGTFDAAAFELGISTSAVSQRIKALERICGTPVLRRGNPALPTDAGTHLLQLARQYFFLAHQTQSQLSTLAIPVGVNADSLAGWFTDVIALVATSPLPGLNLHIDDEEFTSDLLRRGEVIAAVTTAAEPVSGCVSQELGAMEYVPVVARSLWERHVGSAQLTPAQVAALPMLVFNHKDRMQHRALEPVGYPPSGPISTIGSSRELTDAVYAGLGWGAIPTPHAAPGLEDGRLLLVPGAVSIQVRLYWQHWAIDSQPLGTLTSLVHQVAAQALL